LTGFSAEPDWHLDNRKVDLITDGFDAAIGGGIELSAGVIARKLTRAHMVAVASPGYLEGKTLPREPGDLAAFDGIVMRSTQSESWAGTPSARPPRT